MESKVGWTYLSRLDLQKAESQLSQDTKGVIDELGLMEIHQGYADRFFPGTSVLHTRLRYLLFVAWSFEKVTDSENGLSNVDLKIKEYEKKYGSTLKNVEPKLSGVIGRRTLPKLPSQRPSEIYWGALAEWGMLLRNFDDTYLKRSEVLKRLSRKSGHTLLKDIEGNILEERALPFVDLPRKPSNWLEGKKLDFQLSSNEQKFFRELLSQVSSGTDTSLLARLASSKAGEQLSFDSSITCKQVKEVAGSDWSSIILADRAASMSSIIRALYAAMVERACVKDSLGKRTKCLELLNECISVNKVKASKLSVPDLADDLSLSKTEGILYLVDETQSWLRSIDYNVTTRNVLHLRQMFANQEIKKKKNRARLPLTNYALDKRREWWVDKARHDEQIPEGLHYRWHVARRFLLDLENRGESGER